MEYTYYPDGALHFEGEVENGIPKGLQRRWHPNGVLAEEWRMREGIPEGTAKQWNEKGELLGTYTISNGTGIQRRWFENGQLMIEIPWIDGRWNGCVRMYSEDGKCIGVEFNLDNKKVSKKRYDEACASNPQLPRYENEAPLPKPKPAPRETAADETIDGDAFCLELLKDPGRRDALAWLEEDHRATRTLGEDRDEVDSFTLVRTLYRRGAISVQVVKLQHEPEGDQYSDVLVVELPEDQAKRDAVMDFCGDLAAESGFDPTPDVRQRYTLLYFD